MCSLGAGGVSLVSLTERTLGLGGKWVATATYMFLHLALLVACLQQFPDRRNHVLVKELIASPSCAICISCSAR